jgi:hypothetical protein
MWASILYFQNLITSLNVLKVKIYRVQKWKHEINLVATVIISFAL